MKVAVSSCLLGVPCRYDGRSKGNQAVLDAVADLEVVRICPEVMGGLRIPHPANEIQTQRDELVVMDTEGQDNTEAFLRGSRIACDKAVAAGCTHAIMKAKSPSCGVDRVYDGSFTGALVPGDGVCTAMLRAAGIVVMDEADLSPLQN